MEELKGLNEINAATPKHIARYVSISMDIVDRIHSIMLEKNIQQSEIAKRLGKSESEISKWLSGVNNFTLKSIAKLEEAIEEDIIIVNESKISGSLKGTYLVDITHTSGSQGNRAIYFKQKNSITTKETKNRNINTFLAA